MQYAKETLKALWEGLLTIADKNKDQKISVEEWIQVLLNADVKHEPKWMTDYSTYMFKLFDVSGI